MEPAPNGSLTNKYKPRTDPRTSDGPTCSNGGAHSGMYLDMRGEHFEKDLEREKKGARMGF